MVFKHYWPLHEILLKLCDKILLKNWRTVNNLSKQESCGLYEWQRICFVYICIAFGDPILNWLAPPHVCACPKQALYFKYPILWSFFVVKWEVNVRCFVDIGRLVDHHCLNFLSMSNTWSLNC